MDRSGWRVFAGVRREEDAQSLQEAASEKLVPLMLELTDREQIAAAAQRIGSETGKTGLDGLVNNAGITIPCPLEALPIDDFRRLLEVNLIGQVAVTQAMLPQLRNAGGRIVFVSSVSSRRAVPLLGAYTASKAGLGAVADTFRQELRHWGIEVSLIEPGGIETPIWDRGEVEIDAILEQSPIDVDGLYGKMITAFRDLAKRSAARRVTPEKVAASIERALLARRPRTRYLVGADARGQAVAQRLLPDRTLDAAVARVMRS